MTGNGENGWSFVHGSSLKENRMKKYRCMVCNLIYDEEEGWPDDGIAPGTRWEDVPDSWVCPVCGAPKSDFEMTEI